jgi:hypothetical protein
VAFNITNRGASASAAVAISIDDVVAAYGEHYVPSGGTTEVHERVSDPAIPIDPGCLQHNVTVEIWGFIL